MLSLSFQTTSYRSSVASRKMKSVLLIVLCAVIAKTQSENEYGRPSRPYMQQGYTRIKRVKHSSSPPRFYSRPPASIPIKGAYSYTPPPAYMIDNDSPPYPGNSYSGNSRPKVSQRPSEGLSDNDLQNFVKYLSKQDLDKILEYAGHNRDSESSRDPYEKPTDSRPTTDEYRQIYNSIKDTESQKPIKDDNKIFKAIVHEIDLNPKSNLYNEITPGHDGSTKDETHSTFHKDYSNLVNYVTHSTPLYTDPSSNYNNGFLDTNESIQSLKVSEELLPRPVNLRDEDDFDVSFSNNVPTVVKADQSYKLENFGSLPLMNYNSKLDTLSSYHVPHYTVTSSSSSYSKGDASSYAAPSSSSNVEIEPAPPLSAAKEQSDAHLKAVRIWSHKSKGTAYTLHDDGTLSLEKPRKSTAYGR